MQYYTQFLDVDLSGKTVTALGSDGVLVLDGRNSLTTMVKDSEERMKKVQHLRKYVGFKIIKAKDFREEGLEIYCS